MAYYIKGDCHAHFEKLIWLAIFNIQMLNYCMKKSKS
jgi:hypothetical protein